MEFTPEELEKLQRMFLFLIEKKQEQSNGHNGFHLLELQPILNEMVNKGLVKKRPSLNHDFYFTEP